MQRRPYRPCASKGRTGYGNLEWEEPRDAIRPTTKFVWRTQKNVHRPKKNTRPTEQPIGTTKNNWSVEGDNNNLSENCCLSSTLTIFFFSGVFFLVVRVVLFVDRKNVFIGRSSFCWRPDGFFLVVRTIFFIVQPRFRKGPIDMALKCPHIKDLKRPPIKAFKTPHFKGF